MLDSSISSLRAEMVWAVQSMLQGRGLRHSVLLAWLALGCNKWMPSCWKDFLLRKHDTNARLKVSFCGQHCTTVGSVVTSMLTSRVRVLVSVLAMPLSNQLLQMHPGRQQMTSQEAWLLHRGGESSQSPVEFRFWTQSGPSLNPVWTQLWPLLSFGK